MEEQEGPREETIKYLTCLGCKWYKSKLFKSGKHAEYVKSCIHESAPGSEGSDEILGNLSSGLYGNIMPGYWCPFNKD